jgi:ABC-type spermidine/putrescine transport system permease subunit I
MRIITDSERNRSVKSVLLVLPVLLVLLVLYLLPILRLFYSSFFDPDFSLKHYFYFFQNALYFKVLLRTFKMAFFVTLISLVLSYPVAAFLAEAKGKMQYLMVCVILPFWTSLLVRTYAWMVLLQANGIVNKIMMELGLVKEPAPLMYNTLGVLVGMIHVLLPFMILPIYSVLKGVDKDLVSAAYTLGANKFRAFWAVTVPLSLPGIAAGVIFVFVLSLGFFITPALLGGPKVMMIATLIENQINELNNWSFAAAIALILLGFTTLILAICSRAVNFDRLGGKA